VEDQARVARAYNHSIYLMVGMPYLLLGVVGFLVYRGLRQRALAERAYLALRTSPQGTSPHPAAPGGPACSPLPSIGDAS
jgi:hypothetical protein